jgi:hypothetical protein
MTLLVSAPAWAQTPGLTDPDAKELAAYKLTLPVLEKVLVATKNLATAMKNDPRFKKQQALKAEIKKLEEKEEPTEAEAERIDKLRADLDQMEESLFPDTETQTLSQMDAAMRKEPLVNNALTSAGLTPREYAKFLVAFMGAGAVAGMIEQGVIKEVPKEMASAINMENIKFFQANKAQVEAFQKALEALDPGK